MNISFIEVITTSDSVTVIDKITKTLLEKNLASCIQRNNITSYYIWKGRVVKNEEIKIFIKTQKDLFQKVEKEILKIHTYEVPEIIAIPIISGNGKYLEWIKEFTN